MGRLRPWLEPGGPNEDGEWGMHCPFHSDQNRSASFNIDDGVWWCQKCQLGGPVDTTLLPYLDDAPYRYDVAHPQDDGPPKRRKGASAQLTEEQVEAWHAMLVGDKNSSGEEGALNQFMQRRGLNRDIIEQYQIGWHPRWHAYTLPIRDQDEILVNVRFYQLDPAEDRRKIWGVKGHNDLHLFPADQLQHDELVLCEGEWDALRTIQQGIPAITRTGAAETWNRGWSPLFNDKKVLVCQDRDFAGVRGARLIASSLRGHAREIRTVTLPYKKVAKHGKDLSDFWNEGHTSEDWAALVAASKVESARDRTPIRQHATILDTLNDVDQGVQMVLPVSVIGSVDPYRIPKKVEYTCDGKAGPKCKVCPMAQSYNLHHTMDVRAEDPITLKMLHVNDTQMREVMREHIEAVKCNRLVIKYPEHQSAQEIYVRRSVDHVGGEVQGDFNQSRSVVAVGVPPGKLQPNTSVEITGTVVSSPKTQANTFHVYHVEAPPNTLDTYKVTEAGHERLKAFQPSPGQTPLEKFDEIVDDISAHVTRIYGRHEMHMLMDLAFHSPLQFKWTSDGALERGWLNVLVVGDTRTGKSETATRLLEHYGMGELSTVENTSYAGLIGGVEKLSDNKSVVKWGLLPVNDRRLVVLDEVSAIPVEDIGKMSSIRSSGHATIAKIQSGKAFARTRLIWLGNPRDGMSMAHYAFGVDAIRPLIGAAEDIARFDLAMAVLSDTVLPEQINRMPEEQEPRYGVDLCRELVTWAWTRTPDDIVFEPGAKDMILKGATHLIGIYSETVQLVQTGDMKSKLARITAALAARLYSSTDGHTLYITKAHVSNAVKLIKRIYDLPEFGYRDVSKRNERTSRETLKNADSGVEYISQHKALLDQLQTKVTFKRKDIDDWLGLERGSLVFHELLNDRMILLEDNGMYRVAPEIVRMIKGIDLSGS